MQQACKPGSVRGYQIVNHKTYTLNINKRDHLVSAIYLVLPSPASSCGLPPDIGRAILWRRYT